MQRGGRARVRGAGEGFFHSLQPVKLQLQLGNGRPQLRIRVVGIVQIIMHKLQEQREQDYQALNTATRPSTTENLLL